MYDVNYFIKKFSAIPEDKWVVGTQLNTIGQRCALGHCDPRQDVNQRTIGGHTTEEGMALLMIEPHIAWINNGFDIDVKVNGMWEIRKNCYSYLNSPKKRVLACLNDIANKQAGDKAVIEVKNIINTSVLEEELV